MLGNYLVLLNVNKNDKEDIRNSLISLCDFDADMNGDNGKEFTYPLATKNGYESTAEWLADKVMSETKHNNVFDMFNNFMSIWIDDIDKNYYDNYEIKSIDNGDSITIAVSVVKE